LFYIIFVDFKLYYKYSLMAMETVSMSTS